MTTTIDLLEAPGEVVVDLAAARRHLRDPPSDDDPLIAELSRAAESMVEQYLSRALIRQRWRLSLDHFPGLTGAIILPKGRVRSVESIKYVDTDGVQQSLDPSLYQAETRRDAFNRIVPAVDEEWPDTERGVINAVEVEWYAGYSDSREGVPRPIGRAIKVVINDLYEFRESVMVGSHSEIPQNAAWALGPFRITPLA